VTVHLDRYDDSKAADEIDAYDRRREDRFRTPKDKQRNAARFGYADAYGWSEDKARQVAEPEGQEFADHLKETWFKL
jgi:nitroreductase/FMN reductase [NAD(P)H]